MFEERDVEINQEPDFPPAETKISQELSFVDGCEGFNRFHLYNKCTCYKQVETIAAL